MSLVSPEYVTSSQYHSLSTEGEIDDWRTMFNVNVFGPGICVREATPLLAEDGHIVNVGR